MHRKHRSAKVGLRAEPRHSPILEGVIRRRKRFWYSGRQNPHQDVGPFRQIRSAGDDNRMPDFRFYRAFENSNNNIPSASLSSSRRSEAARKSLKSSSDQESDQSILRSGATAPSRSMSRDSSPAASGASLRNAVIKDASCEVTDISMIPDSAQVQWAR